LEEKVALNTIEAASQALAAKMAEQKDAIKAELKAEVVEEVRAELASAKTVAEESPNAKGWVPTSAMEKHYQPLANPKDAGLRLAMGVRAFVGSGKNMHGVPKFIADKCGDKETAKYYEKSIETQNLSSGGVFLTDTLLFAEMFPLLRAKSFLMQAGAQVIMSETDKVTIPGMSAGFSSYWVGESKRIRTSTQAFQQIKLNAKKNAGILVISNDWLREGKNPGVDAIIRDDMIAAVNEGLHYGAIYGDGSEEQPHGLMNDARAGTITVGAVPTPDTMSKFLKAQLDANLDFNPLMNAHVMSAALYIVYFNMKDSYGQYYYREEMRKRTPDAPWGTIDGTPVFVYTKITTGSSGNYITSMLSGLWSEYKILMREAVEMIEAPDGTIVDDDGTVISGLQNDVTFLRVLAKQDGRLRQAGAINKSADVWTVA
jgi:HK97 family phage major capsid protein